MLRKFIYLVLFVSLSFADFSEVDNKQMEKMIKNGVQVIDIRRLGEFKKFGIIKGSHTITFFDDKNEYDISKWMAAFTKIVKSKDQPFILYCAHANRTKVVGNFLSNQVGYKNVYDLKGGINYGWIDKGLKTVRFK